MKCYVFQAESLERSEALKFVPLLRNALQGLPSSKDTLTGVSCSQGACFDRTDRMLAGRQSEEKGTVMDKGMRSEVLETAILHVL